MGKENTIVLNGQVIDTKTGKTISHAEPGLKASNIDGFFKAEAAGVKRTARKIMPPKRRYTQKTKTLSRSGLTKPSTVVQAPVSELPANAKPATLNDELPPVQTKKDLARLSRADKFTKSRLVSKFPAMPSLVKHNADVPVKEGGPMPVQDVRSQTNVKPSVIENGRSEASNEHHTPKKKRLGRKPGLFSATLATLIIIGFYGYQNWPYINMRVASARSGINGKLPGYTPSGFAFENIRHQAGKIVISFGSGGNTFTVSQTSSNWNSEALLSNFVTRAGRPYQTFQNKSRTIYVFDNSNATWVENGLWYQVEGNAGLSSDQLLRIAYSL